jgi:hypothetical protein
LRRDAAVRRDIFTLNGGSRRMHRSNGAATLTVFILLGLAHVNAAHAQGLGLAGGANFTELSDIDTGDQQATFDNATGWHVHLWLELPLGPLAIRPGVRYMDAGSVLEDASIEDGVSIDEDEALSLLEIPIDVRLRVPMPVITPYVMAGPVLRFPAGGNDDDRFRSFSLAGGAGVGVELGLGGLRLFPELKYTFGITDFAEESYELGGVTVTPDEDQQLNAIMLSIGIGL